MATYTPNYNLIKPDYEEPADVAQLNNNADLIDAALSEKQDTLTFDSAPTSGSANPVTSGGVYTGLAGKVNKAGDTMTDYLTLTKSNNYPALMFQRASDPGTSPQTMIQPTIGIDGTSKLNFYQRIDGNAWEGYALPNTTSSLSSNVTYSILTSKSPVTIAQGGTGATSAADARYNLNVPTTMSLAKPAYDSTHSAITAGEYVYVRHHDTLSVGLYVATANIAANAALSTSNLTEVSGGGLNSLNYSEITSQVTFNETVAGNTHFYANHNTVIVYYQGQSKTHAANETLFTLPSGYRPPAAIYPAFVGNANLFGTVCIQAGGACIINQISSTTDTARIYFSCVFPRF